MGTSRLTMAQALVRFLAAQKTKVDSEDAPLFAGVWAIFGHGNVAGLGEALSSASEILPTLRGQNEQSMAHAAIAFAKATQRRRMMAVTSSIGPGATNLVTAAAVAHVNRLPILLLPGDVFGSRFPDPVLQQLESFGDPTLSVNDCLRPVSRYWDRILRPEQLITSLPAALRVLLDPADCGPVTLALPQDVQAEAFDYPEEFFLPRVHRPRRLGPDRHELAVAGEILAAATQPLILAGGGVHYSLATTELSEFAERHGIPVCDTQAGKGALVWDHPSYVGSLGVCGSSAANTLAAEADLVIAVGTRLMDFPTASRSLFQNPKVKLIGLNVAAFDAHKHGARALVADAREGLLALSEVVGSYAAPAPWTSRGRALVAQWNGIVDEVTDPDAATLPTDAQVIGAINRVSEPGDVVVAAAGGLPGELHKLWRVREPGGYHLEYGYSTMGYEIAGGLGVKMAHPDRQVWVLVGDGSYLMLNSEILTSICSNHPITVVVLDNHGYGCIDRLQQATGGAPFNNLLVGPGGDTPPEVDYAAHAASLGAKSVKVTGIAELEAAARRARAATRTSVVVIETDATAATLQGGAWWDVAVPEVSARAEVGAARRAYEENRKGQRVGR